jgi:hypothetical protein
MQNLHHPPGALTEFGILKATLALPRLPSIESMVRLRYRTPYLQEHAILDSIPFLDLTCTRQRIIMRDISETVVQLLQPTGSAHAYMSVQLKPV